MATDFYVVNSIALSRLGVMDFRGRERMLCWIWIGLRLLISASGRRRCSTLNYLQSLATEASVPKLMKHEAVDAGCRRVSYYGLW